MGNLNNAELQQQCEEGQRLLMATEYLASAQVLANAEETAWQTKDFDTLARLYMPLQEARRQIRQRAGEGQVRLDFTAPSAAERPEAVPNASGQFLVAGWGSIEIATQARREAVEKGLYRENFLAAIYPIFGGSRAVVIVALEDTRLPDPSERAVDALLQLVPPFSLVFHVDELPKGTRMGNSTTYGEVMVMWEKLHAPFLAAADAEVSPIRRMEGYRKAIRVDSACELAHQKLSDIAKQMMHRK